MKTKMPNKTLICPAVRAEVLGVKVYRGFARLCDLSEISKADVYDAVKNPKGTQRDLQPKHAHDAYEYVKNQNLGFWPEVFLCIRKNEVITFTPISDEYPDLGLVEIDIKQATRSRSIAISRVDGNHRLHYGAGNSAGYAKIEKLVSFCLAYGLSREEEIQLFKDINKNQKAMNTSHLDSIEVRLTPEDELKRRHPDLYIAQQLCSDPHSPLFGYVFQGGKKPAGTPIPLRALRTGIQYLLSRSSQLPKLPSVEAQYRVIRNYFSAVKAWEPKAWLAPKEYIILRGAGLWAICFLGAHVADLALTGGKFDDKTMLTMLKSGRRWNWQTKGDFIGFSGRSGALEISNKVGRHLSGGGGISTDELFKKIMENT